MQGSALCGNSSGTYNDSYNYAVSRKVYILIPNAAGTAPDSTADSISNLALMSKGDFIIDSASDSPVSDDTGVNQLYGIGSVSGDQPEYFVYLEGLSGEIIGDTSIAPNDDGIYPKSTVCSI